MRLSVIAACLSLCLIGVSAANDAHASIRKDTNIPAEGLGPALNALAKDRNFQIVYVTEEIANVRTQGAVGEFTTEEALKRLLTGTGLTYRYLDDKTVTIGSATTPQSRSSRDSQSTSGSSDDANANQEGKKSSSGGFRVAQVDQGKNSSTSSLAGQASNPHENSNGPPTGLAEIIVTAQKKSERLQDVPVPVSVINADTLAESNKPRLRDYFSSVPGFVVAPAGGSGNQQTLAIRGITSGNFGNPTVGVTVDDVPYGAFTRELAPDLDPGDLQRVEVLRGPQGTLYGASSMGGLVKYVTVDPSTDHVFGRAQADVNYVHHGAQPGYSFRGAINIPLSDTVAVRASAFTRQDAGYIDNPILGIDGVNEAHTSGGRLSALAQLSDTFSLKMSALYEHTKADGHSDVDIQPGLEDLQQNHIRGAGETDQTIQAYSAIVTGKVGGANVTSVTGYNVYKSFDSLDYSFSAAAIAQRLFGVSGAAYLTDTTTKKFAQEIRASVSLGPSLDWLLGGFYTHEDIPYAQNEVAIDTATGSEVGSIYTYSIPIKHTEYAAFTNFTVHITNRIDVQLGGRESHLEEVFEAVNEGGAGLATPIVVPAIDHAANVFTYLVTPQFKVTEDLMLYSRVASGYRPTRSNSFNTSPLVPRTTSPDRTQNYEIGLKGDILNHLVSFDVSLYYIDWKNIQIQLVSPTTNLSYYTNGSRAKSEGVEFSAEAHPWRAFTAAAWVTYDDAVLTEGFPPHSAAYGPAGSRLPFSARYSGNLSLEQEFQIVNGITGFAGTAASYVGDRVGIFIGTPQRAAYPGYTKIDLRAGVKYQSWLFNLYANNVADRRGVLGGGAGNFPRYGFYYIQPRTVGLSIVKDF